MAGKITHRHGTHNSRIGSIVPEPKFYASDFEQLAEYLGKPIPEHERHKIIECVELILSLRDSESTITNQDVIATLSHIGSDAEGAALSFRNCDAATEAIITTALYQIGVRDINSPTIPQIRAAAMLALADNPASTGGRPKVYYRDRFFFEVVQLWKSLGGETPKAWESHDGETTPIVQFAQYLLEAIEPRAISNSVVAKSLRKVIA